MAAMLSSFTLLSRAPAPGPKLSPAAASARLPLRRQLPPPAVTSVVPLRWASRKDSQRAPLCGNGVTKDDGKFKYDIQPSALQTAPKSTSAGKHWNLMADEDFVILKLRVGGLPKKDVDIYTTTDQTHLVIKYNGDNKDATPASMLNLQLAFPLGYDGRSKARAMLLDGWLVILIAKPPHDSKPIGIVDDAKSIGTGNPLDG